MLKEALDYLFKQSEPKVLNVGGDGRTAHVGYAGTIQSLTVPPKPRESKVDSVSDLCAAALSYGEKDRLSVWIAGESVVLISDDDDRRDRVTLPLRRTAQWKKIRDLPGNPVVDQSAFIQLLRVDLPGVVGREGLLPTVRALKFKQSAEGTASIQHGNESLGRVIENQVTGAGDIPEQIEVLVPLYDNPGEAGKTQSVTLDVDIVAAKEHFRLRPLPHTVEAAQNAALESIREEITQELKGVRVFYGTP